LNRINAKMDKLKTKEKAKWEDSAFGPYC